MGFLTEITDRIRADLASHPLDDGALLVRASSRPPARPLAAALRAAAARDGIGVIAEVKRSSPSAGAIADESDPGSRAARYAEGGAAAISVLTEPRHFGGSLSDLEAVRAAVDLPVLRKDFLVHPTQVIQARAAGADAVLLITASLPGDELPAMLAAAGDLGMDALVETHSDEDLDRAIAAGAEVIGVNARDLETLEVDVDRALLHLARIPQDRLGVLESGIARREQVEAAASAGASAILVGEALMRAADPVVALRELIGKESRV